MRILFFGESPGVHERRFLSKLAATDHEVWFLPAFADPPIGYLPEQIRGLRAILPGKTANGGLGTKAMRRLQQHLAEFQPQVVHAGPLSSCAFWAARANSSRLLAMSWGYDLLHPTSMLDSWKARYALRHSVAGICDCETVRHEMVRVAGHLAQRTFVFPWGVELDKFHPNVADYGVRRARRWEGKHLVVSTRSFEPLYGIETLVRAAIKAWQRASNLRFVLAGSGSLLPWAERMVKQHKAEEAFCFLGLVPEEVVACLFHEADVYISCSRADGTSISLLQAFAAGRTVIVSDLPATREWVTPLQNGWLVQADDVDSFAQALVDSTMLGRDRLARMGESNLAIARSRADWDTNFNILLEAYDFVGKQN